jgi:DNA replication and repair protein RecF
MNVEKIELNGFRNFEWETAEFSPCTNVIFGKNAQGKTNLLEAIYVLSNGRSFRSTGDKELIHFDYDSAQLMAQVYSSGRQQNIRMEIKNGKKNVQINAVRKNVGELADTLKTVLFCPEDLYLVKEGPQIRRRFLDNAISQIRPAYRELLKSYREYYAQKKQILKEWREVPSLLDTLDIYSEGICRLSAKIIRYRASYVARLVKEAETIHRDFAAGENLALRYQTVSTVTDTFASEKQIYYEICDHQEAHRKAELESGYCLTGTHKDDLEILINGKDARAFASQGQTRTAALSIKLAEREIVLQEIGEYPVLLLDDVLSELDAQRQAFVLNRISDGQTFITCCADDNISQRTGGKVMQIREGKIL